MRLGEGNAPSLPIGPSAMGPQNQNLKEASGALGSALLEALQDRLPKPSMLSLRSAPSAGCQDTPFQAQFYPTHGTHWLVTSLLPASVSLSGARGFLLSWSPGLLRAAREVPGIYENGG